MNNQRLQTKRLRKEGERERETQKMDLKMFSSPSCPLVDFVV